MPIRFHYYDMFVLLSNRRHLIRFNNTEPYRYYLDGHFAADILGPHFIENKWVELTHQLDDGARTFYSLSEHGKEIFEEGKHWYDSLPFYTKILGRCA